MFKFLVILVHSIIFIVASFIGLAGKYNLASPEPDADYRLWFLTIAIFNIIVLVSAFLQLRIRKAWVLFISTIGLIALFLLTLQYIYPYMMDLF